MIQYIYMHIYTGICGFQYTYAANYCHVIACLACGFVHEWEANSDIRIT